MTDGKPSLLEQLMEEALQRGRSEATASDFAVNLSTTDKDGTHTIEGIPISQVGRDFLARFGIARGEEGGGDGTGSGDGKDGGDGKQPPADIRTYFGGKAGQRGKTA